MAKSRAKKVRSRSSVVSIVAIFIVIYRRFVIVHDIIAFFVNSLLEYVRLTYRLFVPRKKMSVAGEVALVTGAGQGIGRKISLKLAELGATIVCVDINEETNNETVRKIQEANGVSFGYKCDVSNREQVDELFKVVSAEVGDVNILINNAGILFCRPFVQQSTSQIERVINTNLLGQMWMLKAFLPRMIQMDRGHVVSLTSIAGYAGAPNMVPYTASKFAVRGMMEALYMELRQENRKHNVHLMTVAPFVVDNGRVRYAKIRFPCLLNIVSADDAADTIITNMRQRISVVFIPGIYYYIHTIVRLLPLRVQLLLTDFVDTGIDIQFDNFD